MQKATNFRFFYQFFWEVLQSASSIGGIEWPELSKGLVWPFLEWKWDIITKLWLENIKKYILILRNSHFFARQAHVWKGNQASNFTLANNMFTTLLTINWGIQDIAYRSLWPAGLCSMLLWSDIRNGFFFTI